METQNFFFVTRRKTSFSKEKIASERFGDCVAKTKLVKKMIGTNLRELEKYIKNVTAADQVMI